MEIHDQMSEVVSDAEILIQALSLMRQHIDRHDCLECSDNLQLLLRAVLLWAEKQIEINSKAESILLRFMNLLGHRF